MRLFGRDFGRASEGKWSKAKILATLDDCCRNSNFPMLDNGYIYLAATRLSAFHSDHDWGIVIEVFGFSPRVGIPDTCTCSLASRLHNRKTAQDYRTVEAYHMYLKRNPHNEFRSFAPIEEGDWMNDESREGVALGFECVVIRGRAALIPPITSWPEFGVQPEHPKRPRIFELCRVLAGTERESLLATPEERRLSMRPEMRQVLQLEAWRHPDVLRGELPSETEAFVQIADALSSGDVSRYRPTQPPNTHWSNWPLGGSL